MPQILVDRPHGLSLLAAHAVAEAWVREAKADFGMQVHRAPADPASPVGLAVWHFKRVGASGVLRVTPKSFVLDVKLGFLLGTYKERIEAELLQNLERRLVDERANQSTSVDTNPIASKQ